MEVREFRVSADAVVRLVSTSNYLTKEKRYAERATVERVLLLMKVEGVLGYFTLAGERAPREIGFRAPE